MYFSLVPIFLFGCQSSQFSSEHKAQGLSLKNPEKRVLCDQYVCANAEGISHALTVKYLGQQQANKVFSQGDFDKTQFTFENGIFCDTKTQTCHVDRYFNGNGQRSDVVDKYTQALFGQSKKQ